jgi:hypothetical protein
MCAFGIEVMPEVWIVPGVLAFVLWIAMIIRVVRSSPRRKRMSTFLVRVPISDYYKHAPKSVRVVALVLLAYGLFIFTYMRVTMPSMETKLSTDSVFAFSGLFLFLYGIELAGLFPSNTDGLPDSSRIHR